MAEQEIADDDTSLQENWTSYYDVSLNNFSLKLKCFSETSAVVFLINVVNIVLTG